MRRWPSKSTIGCVICLLRWSIFGGSSCIWSSTTGQSTHLWGSNRRPSSSITKWCYLYNRYIGIAMQLWVLNPLYIYPFLFLTSQSIYLSRTNSMHGILNYQSQQVDTASVFWCRRFHGLLFLMPTTLQWPLTLVLSRRGTYPPLLFPLLSLHN